MNTQPTINAKTRPTLHAWNDYEHRDRFQHIVDDDEHAADLLAEALPEGTIDLRHPYALCGVSLVMFPGTETRFTDEDFWSQELCPVCADLAHVSHAATCES